MPAPDDEAKYQEVYVYSMGRPGFILQHVVDAQAAQTATAETKPIALMFALVGLYLRVEKQYEGTPVQREHMRLAKTRPSSAWPRLALPESRGSITAADVHATAEGPDRDAAIDRWCAEVWAAFAPLHRETIAAIVESRA